MKSLIKLVIAAMMAALTCIATMVIAVPSPTGGFIHPGDGFVILSGIILGPFFGGLAAGIGSMLADLLLGYTEFALATLIIKAAAAIISYFTFQLIKNKHRIIFAGILGGVTVTIGYFIYESILLGSGLAAAAVGITFNLVQNAFGIIVSVMLYPILMKVPQVSSIMGMNETNAKRP